MTKLTRQQVTKIVNARARDVPAQELADKYGVDLSYIYSLAKGRHRKQPGHMTIPVRQGVGSEQAHTRKLTPAAAIVIRNLRGKASAVEVAKAAGVSPGSVYKIWQGRTWKEAR